MKTWTTKDGRLIAYGDLSDRHLLNILRMLRRAAELTHAAVLAQYLAGPRPTADGAEQAFDAGFDALLESSWRDHTGPTFADLLAEAESRPGTAADAEKIASGDDLSRLQALYLTGYVNWERLRAERGKV